MLNWLKKRKRKDAKKKGSIPFVDIDGSPLQEGDLVMAQRYELGEAKILKGEQGWEYESLESGKRVSYARMIDAATKHQKVRKVRGAEEQ